MNRDEIRWIVENLFIGDRFARGEISAGGGATFNMRAVRSPVVVFASAGDNITPPGQALRWIADVYRDEQEIKTLGQTIVYLMHDDIGHLGIFVSGAVALKEHSEIAELLTIIDSVAPGLYEMLITRESDSNAWQVELKERTMADIRARSGEAQERGLPGGRQDLGAEPVDLRPVRRPGGAADGDRGIRREAPADASAAAAADAGQRQEPADGAGRRPGRAGQAEPPPGPAGQPLPRLGKPLGRERRA